MPHRLAQVAPDSPLWLELLSIGPVLGIVVEAVLCSQHGGALGDMVTAQVHILHARRAPRIDLRVKVVVESEGGLDHGTEAGAGATVRVWAAVEHWGSDLRPQGLALGRSPAISG